jgi:hypothetical protein
MNEAETKISAIIIFGISQSDKLSHFLEGYYSDDQNGRNRQTVSNIINKTVEYDLIRIRTN